LSKEINKLFTTCHVECPFEFATKLNLKINFVDFPAPIYGYYKPILYAEPVLINKNLSSKLQEKTCEYLVLRHLLYHGVEFCLDEETFERLETVTERDNEFSTLF